MAEAVVKCGTLGLRPSRSPLLACVQQDVGEGTPCGAAIQITTLATDIVGNRRSTIGCKGSAGGHAMEKNYGLLREATQAYDEVGCSQHNNVLCS